MLRNIKNGPIPLNEKMVIRMIGGDVPLHNKGFYMLIWFIHNELDSYEIFNYLIKNRLTGRRLMQALGNDFMKNGNVDLPAFLSFCRSKTNVLL